MNKHAKILNQLSDSESELTTRPSKKSKCNTSCFLKVKPDPATIERLNQGFEVLNTSKSNSLLKKHLKKEIFDLLKYRVTSFGSSLLDCIQSGLENLDAPIGIYAADAESYTTFNEIFDPIIEDCQNGFKLGKYYTGTDYGNIDQIGNLDPTNSYIISIRLFCTRSIHGYPFAPRLNEAQYNEIEKRVSSCLNRLDGDLKGTYFPLGKMDDEMEKKLKNDNLLFKEGDKLIESASAFRFWPTGRGIFYNENKTFLVWVNQEEHIKIFSIEEGSDLNSAYRRLCKAINHISQMIAFSKDKHLGFITFSVTNLGTAMYATMKVKLFNLGKHKDIMKRVADKYFLEFYEYPEEQGVFEIYNVPKLGMNEFESIKLTQDGIIEMIKMDYFL